MMTSTELRQTLTDHIAALERFDETLATRPEFATEHALAVRRIEALRTCAGVTHHARPDARRSLRDFDSSHDGGRG